MHFLRNALDHLPRRANDDCLQELRWIYDRRELAEVRRDLSAWLTKWSGKYGRLCSWVEENIEETLTYYRLPPSHHKHMKSTNMLERLNQEIKRRTHVVRMNAASCLRLVRALAVEMHDWLVPRVAQIDGYSRFSFTRASAVVNCQSALACFLFRWASQAAVSSVSIALSGMRRSRH